jgi:uncharacterized membrane protein YkoI
VAGPGGPGDAEVNDRPTFTRNVTGKDTAVTAATDRRLLIAVAAVGVVAGLAGIGAAIAGRPDRPAAPPAASSTTATATDAVGQAEAEAIALERVPGTVDRARSEDEGWEVRVDTPDGHVDVLVDATTGEVLEIDD